MSAHQQDEPSPGLYLTVDDLLSLSRGLRAPLDSLLGTAREFLEDGPPLDEETLAAIQRNGARQVRLLDNLAALADLQMDMVPRGRERVFVDLVLDRLRAGVRPELLDSGVELLLPGTRSGVIVTGNDAQLAHALRELVRNAIAASRPGARVGVTVARQLRGVTVEVADSGRGIAPVEQLDILLPFERTSYDLAHRTPGTGLGLTVADGIVRAHGGTLDLLSTPGRGTRVIVTLPLAGA